MKCRGQQFHFPYYERPRVVVNTEAELEQVIQEHGVLITCSAAAAMAGVSDQRIQALIELGKFTKFVIFGLIQISKREFDQWKNSARTSGRPWLPENGCLPPTISESATAYDDPQLFAELPAQRKGGGQQK